MNIIVAVILLSAAVLAVYGEETPDRDKVVGIRDYPWLALLILNETSSESRIYCGGALISARYVLTLASCLSFKVYDAVKVRLGEFNTSSYPTDLVETVDGSVETVTVVEIAIENLVRHVSYTYRNPHMNNVGLIRLKTNAPYNDFIRPICLPTRDVNNLPNQEFSLYAAGWKRYSNLKRHIVLPYVSLEKCRAAYERNEIDLTTIDRHICAGADTDICGFVGYPLMYKDGDKFTIVGIVNYVNKICGQEGASGVHANVFKHLYWIITKMKFLNTV